MKFILLDIDINLLKHDLPYDTCFSRIDFLIKHSKTTSVKKLVVTTIAFTFNSMSN